MKLLEPKSDMYYNIYLRQRIFSKKEEVFPYYIPRALHTWSYDFIKTKTENNNFKINFRSRSFKYPTHLSLKSE